MTGQERSQGKLIRMVFPTTVYLVGWHVIDSFNNGRDWVEN